MHLLSMVTMTQQQALHTHSCLLLHLPLTIVGAKPVFIGVVGGSHLDGGRCWEHQDMGAGSILRCVQLRRLHVQRSASAKHGAHCDGIFKDQSCVSMLCRPTATEGGSHLTQKPQGIDVQGCPNSLRIFREPTENTSDDGLTSPHIGDVKINPDRVHQIFCRLLT